MAPFDRHARSSDAAALWRGGRLCRNRHRRGNAFASGMRRGKWSRRGLCGGLGDGRGRRLSIDLRASRDPRSAD